MDLKARTVKTVKWSTIDKFSSQLIYAAVGVVLANELSKEDFGLVGALTIFQAFALIFVDSGFGAALLQKKNPEERDYSTVFWFNLLVSLGIYVLLFFCAPLIADIFHDGRLVSMSRVMFIAFVVNGLGIVQTNRLTKAMHMRPVAMANIIALLVSGGLGIGMALGGFGAWALVWQTLSLAIVKTLILWITGHWWPRMHFAKATFRDIRRVGASVFSSSILNTVCLQVYNFVIGAFYSLPLLGVYTQADKWSKMGSASISQIMMSSFVPLLSGVQDSRENFIRYMKRINRFTAFIVFPFMLWLTAAGQPIFHFLFHNKWDEAIPLFQILMIRGIFLVLCALYNNFLLAKGKARALLLLEVVKDGLIVVALFSTVWSFSLEWLVWGQLGASLVTWIVSVEITRRALHVGAADLLLDLLPFFAASFVMGLGCYALGWVVDSPVLQLLVEFAAGVLIYIAVLRLRGVYELSEALNLLKKFLSKIFGQKENFTHTYDK